MGRLRTGKCGNLFDVITLADLISSKCLHEFELAIFRTNGPLPLPENQSRSVTSISFQSKR